MLNVLPQRSPRHKTNLLNKSKQAALKYLLPLCALSHCNEEKRWKSEVLKTMFPAKIFISPLPALFKKNLCNLARINKSKLKPNNSKPIACRQKVKKSCNVLFYIIEVTGWNRINCSCVFSSVNISSKCVIGCRVGGVGVGKYPGLA